MNSSRFPAWGQRLFQILIGLYLLLAIAVLGVRYGLSPALQYGQEAVQNQLSAALGAEVRWAHLAVRWQRFSPRIEARDVQVHSPDGQALLTVPFVEARLDWWSWVSSDVGLLRLLTRGVALNLVRLPDGRLDVPLLEAAGDAVARPSTESTASDDALIWLLSQPSIEFQDARLSWQDGTRDGRPLRLQDVDLVLRRTANGGLGVALSAYSHQTDTQLELRARLDGPQILVSGEVPKSWASWLRMEGVRPADWRPWLDVPEALQEGQMDVQFWGDASDAGPRVTMQLRAQGVRWALGDQGQLAVADVNLWARADLSVLRHLGRSGQLDGEMAFQGQLGGAQLDASEWFDHSLSLGAIQARGMVQGVPGADHRLRLVLDHARWLNPDISLEGRGHWQSGVGAGEAQFQGSIERARLAAIHRYLPLEVDEDARAWLAGGLRQGVLQEASWRLSGNLLAFPFGDHPDDGDFYLQGAVRDAVIDIVPDAVPEERWPLLEDIQGQAQMRRTDLQWHVDSALVRPTPGESIALTGVTAQIPDIENDATLQVGGQTSASAQAWLAFLEHSPVGALLDGLFEQAQASGTWRVPLALTVPLLHSIDTQVEGRVEFSDHASLRFLPTMPPFQELTGQLHFNEQGIRLPEPLQARFLGGPLRMSGVLGRPGTAGLSLHGRASAKALQALVDVPGMQRVGGTLTWNGLLQRRADGYHLGVDSSLEGLELDFPAPLAKPSSESLPLRIEWSEEPGGQERVVARLGDALNMVLVHAVDAGPGEPYFGQAAIGLGRAAGESAPGLQLEVAYPLMDLDLWDRIGQEFSPAAGSTGARSAPPVWPALNLFSVQADQLRLLGTRLDQASLRAVRSAAGQWSVNVRSQQTQGTLKWQEHQGVVQGKVNAHFDRLSIGDDARDTSSLLPSPDGPVDPDMDDEVHIPAIVLQVEDFILYGHSLGPLWLEGRQDPTQALWTLDRLRLGPAGTQLEGTGLWRLRGPERGLSIKARMQTDNLGAWMDRAGWPDVMQGGAGGLQGHFNWRNLPWTTHKRDISGQLHIELDSGRFPQVDSGAVKLLELLSLQSISRLFRLQGGLAGLWQDGLPFDQLRGTLSLDQGLATMQDYKMIGPAGTLLLEGTAHIVDERLDMQAVVVPSLDASGASVAAGIAINPLVGLGAFVTQWLLKEPLARAMTKRYDITGTWDDPQLHEVSLPHGSDP